VSKKSNGNGKMTMTRRDFLKATAAAGAAGGLLDLAAGVEKGVAVPQSLNVTKRTTTTCACCSVGCGQVVELDGTNVVDVYGDPNHVTNRGALCPKGGASVQWINGDRRLGTSSCHLKDADTASIDGPRYRDGNGPWRKFSGADTTAQWNRAITLVAARLKTAAGRDTGWPGSYADGQNCMSLAFLGCSHATNEENWVYRKLIANVGTNNTEHQARI